MKKKAIRRQLNAILAKLETMQAEIEDVLGEVLVPFPTLPDTGPRPDMHDDDIDYGPIGVIPQEAVGRHDPNTATGTGWRPCDEEAENYADLRTYIVNEDGTRRVRRVTGYNL